MPDDAFANSGIQIRSWEGPAKWQVCGYQPDMDWKNIHGHLLRRKLPRHPRLTRPEGGDR